MEDDETKERKENEYLKGLVIWFWCGSRLILLYTSLKGNNMAKKPKVGLK